MVADNHHSTINIQIKLRRTRDGQPGFALSIDTNIPGKGVTAIYGASGSGKTTLLRCIAGLEPDAIGKIEVNGRCFQNSNQFLPPEHRDIGYVFQDPTLFPHLTVQQNIDFARKRANTPLPESQYEALMKVLAIQHLLVQYPDRLSGGEKQRVAIARAVASNPAVLLLDEPLSALDSPRKQELLGYLEKLHSIIALPILYVSHAQAEIARLADHVVIMDSGAVIQQGPVAHVFQTLTAASDTEVTSLLEGIVVQQDERYHLSKVAVGDIDLWVSETGLEMNQTVRLCLAARDISISLQPEQHSSILNKVEVVVHAITPAPDVGFMMVHLKHNELSLYARITEKSADDLALEPELQVWAQIKSAAIIR